MESLSRLLADLKGVNGTLGLYCTTYRVFAASTVMVAGTSFCFNAPFGRFSRGKWAGTINANLGWWLMEIVSPITFLLSITAEPLTSISTMAFHLDAPKRLDRFAQLSTPVKILTACFVVHYINRSTISVLRQHAKRAPMHISVPLSAISWNLANGSLMGSWLGGRTLPIASGVVNSGAVPESAMHSPIFWCCIGIWLIGFLGNIFHDDILNNLRKPGPDGKQPPRYSIPHGGLYSMPFGGISFPSYLCEWIEWAAFALACSAFGPPPALPSSVIAEVRSSDSVTAVISTIWAALLGAYRQIFKLPQIGDNPLLESASFITPPWLFVYSEIAAMLPRALAGHRWYKEKFGAQFPKSRKVIFPGIF